MELGDMEGYNKRDLEDLKKEGLYSSDNSFNS